MTIVYAWIIGWLLNVFSWFIPREDEDMDPWYYPNRVAKRALSSNSDLLDLFLHMIITFLFWPLFVGIAIIFGIAGKLNGGEH